MTPAERGVFVAAGLLALAGGALSIACVALAALTLDEAARRHRERPP